MQLYIHRGYRIQTQVTAQWQAIIWAPGSSSAITQLPKATIEEGETVSLQRAKALIDRWEARAARGGKTTLPGRRSSLA
ncbi:MAG: hypothetical protein NTV73_11070 [Hyphomicrobiales bacterium]|nr:hypothetical protein [Hyphomicrobiales bacterium]